MSAAIVPPIFFLRVEIAQRREVPRLAGVPNNAGSKTSRIAAKASKPMKA
jgi:hypothetical protein